MKSKIKNVIVGTFVIVSLFFFSACKKKSEPQPTLQESTVNAVVENREFYVGDKLSDIMISLSEGDTAGEIEWVNLNFVLVLGENNVDWKFTPTDSAVYKEKTGSLKISAVEPKSEPTVNALVSSEKVYAENKLSSVLLKLSEGDTAGELSWRDENAVIELGEKEYEWKFTPTDLEKYNEIIGKIKLTAIAQSLVSIEIKTAPTKTNYVAFEKFNDKGMVLNAVYDGGKTEEISQGWQILYNQDDSLKATDSKVVAKYQGKTCDVLISVSRVELDKPEIDGTYVFNSKNQTAKLKQTASSNLYTYNTVTKFDAGTYDVDVTIKDFVNYKWKGESSKVVKIPFVIEEASHDLIKTNYSGTYDGLAHMVKVEGDRLSKVYYSLSPLDETNYQSGTQQPISTINAIDAKVYFYAVAETNYKNYADFLTFKIDKALAKVETDYCFAVESDNNVNIPLEYVSVCGIDDESLDITEKIEFVYYTSYTDKDNNSKTTSLNGAMQDGSAPKTAGEYFVVTRYLGNENYKVTEKISKLVIDSDDSPLFAHGSEDEFAWQKDDKTAYVKFEKGEVDGLAQIVFDAKINGEISSGVILKENNVCYALFDSASKTYVVEVTADVLKLKNEDGTTFKTLSKWVLPKYLGVYEKDTITTDVATPNSTMTIYNDYGVLKFTFVYYQYDLDGVTVRPAATKTGYINYISGFNKLVFCVDAEFEEVLMTNYDVDENVILQVVNVNIPGLKVNGDYVRA